MPFKLIPDISVCRTFLVIIKISVGLACYLLRLVDDCLNSAVAENRNTTATTTTTRDAGPNQRPATNNEPNSSATSENRNTMDHKTLWNSFGFTDEIDRQDFGRYWEAVKELKYNDPSLKSTSTIMPRKEDESFCKDAWIRLGWYLAKNDIIEEVDCRYSKVITDEVVEYMFGSVVWTPKESIKSMNFSYCSITTHGIKRLIPFIKAASRINKFCIDLNEIGTEGFDLVATALCGNQIEILSFNYCAINNIVPALTHCKFPELKSFYFSGNQIGDKGAKFIAKKLFQFSPKLEMLGLDNCGISDQGANSIANALASNATLKVLWLSRNSISDEGIASFAKALHSNLILMTLHMSNSTIGWSQRST